MIRSLYKNISVVILFLSVISITAQEKSGIASPMKDVNQVIDLTLDSLNIAITARPIAGSSRKDNNPVLFLVGNSTMRTGTLGNGNNGQWGWGYFANEYFDKDRITVENHALGGTSSRTFYNRLWPDVIKGVKKGDYVIIELGHNDNGPYDSGRARATIPGIGNDTLNVTIKETGEKETVFTYGEYMRKYIREVKAAGAYPILFSLTPRNAWVDADSTIVRRVNETFGLWAKQVAESENVPFIDLNEITAKKFESFGKEKVKYMFYLDRIHTSAFGARVNAESAAEGIRNYKGLNLAQYLLPENRDSLTGRSRKEGRPVVFTIGDSTVRNKDKDDDSQWGWGSVFGKYFDENKASVENHAMAGRSARTYLDEGRWDKVYNALQPGDYVFIQFGHNDGGEINTGKARGEIHGCDINESKVLKMEKTGQFQVIYSYGWYLRKFILDAKEKGAIPVIVSFTPRNRWTNGKIERRRECFAKWAKETAEANDVAFIDLNKLSADYLDKTGEKKAAYYYKGDHTHTSKKGAELNARLMAEAVKKSNLPLAGALKRGIK